MKTRTLPASEAVSALYLVSLKQAGVWELDKTTGAETSDQGVSGNL